MKTSDQFKLKIWTFLLVIGLLVLFFSSITRTFKEQATQVKNYVATNSAYNETTANHSLMFSLATYCSESQLESWTCAYCRAIKHFTLYKYVTAGTDNSLVALVGYDSGYDQIVLVFRGSDDLPNWVTDFDFVQVDYPAVAGGRVHAGFYEAWKTMQDAVTTVYKEVLNDYPNSPVLLTGHSLGAALAALAFLDLKNVYANDSSLYPEAFYLHSFGQPRWANPTLAKYFTSQISYHWRVVYLHDIVPQIPPAFLDYQHTVSEIWYWCNKPLSYYLCDPSQVEDPKCQYPGGVVSDHLHYLNDDFECSEINLPDVPFVIPTMCIPDPNK